MRWRPIGLLFLTAGILLAPVLRAQPAPTCEQWNTEEFFEAATVDHVTACLAASADVTARDEDEITPLHWATWISDHPAVVEALLAAGAHLEARNGTGSTPLHNAAANNENPAVVEALLAAGANIEARDDRGFTPLHRAANANETLAILEVLVAAGANVNAPDDGGIAPVQYAAWANENPAVLGALFAAGADRQARTEAGRTLLHLVAQNNQDPVVIDTLVAAGARPMGRDRTGRTPLHLVVSNNNPAMIVQALLAAGAQLNAQDEDGNTAIHLAAAYHDEDRHGGAAIAALLDAGADPTARNAAGQTPWDLADENDALRGSDGYWLLNDARFNAPGPDVRTPTATPPARQQPEVSSDAPPQRQGRGCEIPGYPTPTNIQSLGVSWCGPGVDFQKRAYALQAADAWCAIDIGSSSTPEQISARHQEINPACDLLDALHARLGGRPCLCPAGYRP